MPVTEAYGFQFYGGEINGYLVAIFGGLACIVSLSQLLSLWRIKNKNVADKAVRGEAVRDMHVPS